MQLEVDPWVWAHGEEWLVVESVDSAKADTPRDHSSRGLSWLSRTLMLVALGCYPAPPASETEAGE